MRTPKAGRKLPDVMSPEKTNHLLDGAEEAAVVRSALEFGVPRDRVMDELTAEVQRRLARLEDPH